MNYHYYLMAVNFLLMFSTVITGIYKFRSADLALRIFTLGIVSSFIFESVAYLSAILYHNNTWVYAINSILEVAIMCLYFNYSIEFFPKYYLGIAIGFISTTIGVWSLCCNKVLFGGHHIFFTFYEAFLIIVLAMLSLSQNLYKTKALRRDQKTHFMISIVLMFFWTLAFLSWGLYDDFTSRYPSEKWVIDLGLFILNIFANFFFLLIYITLPKRSKQL